MLEEKLYSIHAIHTGERKRLKKRQKIPDIENWKTKC